MREDLKIANYFPIPTILNPVKVHQKLLIYLISNFKIYFFYVILCYFLHVVENDETHII